MKQKYYPNCHIKTYHKDKVMIITELCQEGTLYDYLKKKKKIEEKQCNQIMRCIIEGCCYLHDKGILHRDLKPQNIFRKNKKVKIADFGFAVQIGNNKLLNLNVGSPLYMPYEALSQNKFGIQSDIFAIGAIWYELLTGNTPFSAATQQELRQKTKNNQFRTKEIKCNKKIQKTIFKCLTKTISERPKIKDLLQVIKETTQIQRLRTQSLVVSANIPKQMSINETKDEKNKQNNHQKIQSKENCLIITANKQNRSFTNCNKENKFKYFKYLPKITQVKNKDKANIYPLTIKIKQSLQLKTKHQGPQDFIKILGRLAQLNLGFLPYSIQAKFLSIINKYSNLLLTSKDEPMPILQRFSQFKDDDLIAEIDKCQSQSTLCKCLYNFMRRLMRIAKSYKEWSGKLKDLNLLWERVQRICKMEVPSS